jgi:hypothetical protein
MKEVHEKIIKLVTSSWAKKRRGNRKHLKQARTCSHLPNATTTRSE